MLTTTITVNNEVNSALLQMQQATSVLLTGSSRRQIRVGKQVGGLTLLPPMHLLSLTKILCSKQRDISVLTIPFVILLRFLNSCYKRC